MYSSKKHTHSPPKVLPLEYTKALACHCAEALGCMHLHTSAPLKLLHRAALQGLKHSCTAALQHARSCLHYCFDLQ